MGEISGVDDTRSERMFRVAGVLVVEPVLSASRVRKDAGGQFSRCHQGGIDDVLSCLDRLLRTERERCQKKISQLCSTGTGAKLSFTTV